MQNRPIYSSLEISTGGGNGWMTINLFLYAYASFPRGKFVSRKFWFRFESSKDNPYIIKRDHSAIII
jgi:hypothetical protein